MADLALAIIFLVSLSTLILVIYFHVTGSARDLLTKVDFLQLIRIESDNIRSGVEAQSGGLRREVVDVLGNHQKNLINILTNMSNEAISNRELFRNSIETRLSDFTTQQVGTTRALQEQLESSFQTLERRVADTLQTTSEHQKEALQKTEAALQALAQKHEQTQESLRSTVENRLDVIRIENTAKLEEMRQTVDEKLHATLEARLGESFGRVVEQLGLVAQGIGEMKALANNVGDLKTVLTNPRVRGTFGEVQLALLIEDFLTPEQYVRNAQIKDGSAERVEYAIKMRTAADGEEVLLPVDAKFPREDYEHLIAAIHSGDTESAVKFRKQLDARLKSFARDIKDKYIYPPRTTEFGILFLPTEGLYAEALREPALFEYLRRDRFVILAGPTTFSAILSAFRMNFRSMALAKQSSEVWRVLSAVRSEFVKYNEVVTKLGNQLNTAAKSVENLRTRTRVMDRKLSGVELLPNDGTAERLLRLTADGVNVSEADDEMEESSNTPEVSIEAGSGPFGEVASVSLPASEPLISG